MRAMECPVEREREGEGKYTHAGEKWYSTTQHSDKKSTVGLKLGLNVSSHALRSFVHDVGSLKKMIFLSRTYEKHGKQSSLYAYRSTYVCGLVCDDDKAIKITTETDKKFHSKKWHINTVIVSFFAQSARNIWMRVVRQYNQGFDFY